MPGQVINYYSEGDVIAANLYTPERALERGKEHGEKHPAIILCHGFTGIRDVPTHHEFCDRLTRSGYVALSFDYRGFGDSGGERGRLAPLEQVDDIRNSITYMEAQDFVDPTRIGLWGTSYGCLTAPHAAAVDVRVKAVLGILGVATGYSALTNNRTPEEMKEWETKVALARRRRVLFNEVERSVRVLDVFRDEQSKIWLPMLWDYSERWRNPIGFDSVGRVMDHRPIDHIHKISPRALGLFCATRDTVGDTKSLRSLFDAAREPKRWHEFDAGHYDMYQGKPLEELMKEVIRFFDDFLK